MILMTNQQLQEKTCVMNFSLASKTGVDGATRHKPSRNESLARNGRLPLRSPIRAEDPRLRGPLYKAALEGDWERAEEIIKKNPTIVGASIAKGSYTALHVAAGARQVDFVEKLLTFINDENKRSPNYLRHVLRLQDETGNTALCLAAAAGSVKITEIMIGKDKDLPNQPGSGGMRPLYFAALFGHQEMATCLFKLYKPPPGLSREESEQELLGVFFSCIKTGLYGLASEIFQKKNNFASKRDNDRKTALHLLAKKPSAFNAKNPADELVNNLWNKVGEEQNPETFIALYTDPSHLLFDAVESGNSKFVTLLLEACPALIWDTNDKNWSIIHAAVKHRDESVFSKIYEIGLIKDIIAASKDNKNGNTLLHLAAELAPESRLNELPGAAFQIQRELVWFEEVKKVMQPSYKEMKNKYDKTADELFTSEHRDLLKEGRKWMNGTARSCTIVSTLIAGALFSAGITVSLGGAHDFKNASFQIFIISDAIAFLLALGAILMFLAILTSTYAERDFRQDLPNKLIGGVILLLFSIIAMMVALSAAFFIAYGKYYLPILVTLCAALPVILYVVQIVPLFSLFRQKKFGDVKRERKKGSPFTLVWQKKFGEAEGKRKKGSRAEIEKGRSNLTP
ncbi:Hypothetical predicted protein [Prunus dulcis]|uniref:PGG domain-containing protein n=1 Tax=Prunus dulcis TaxID=3755 RepID=A0A5E4GAC8_PRUDU|nr:Hypothetical predicted protein [Prunus dulcis]